MSSQIEANLLMKCYIQNAQLNILKSKARDWMCDSATFCVCVCVTRKAIQKSEHRVHLNY